MKKRWLLALFLVSLGFLSCRVVLLPAYDAEMVQQIDSTAKMIDRLYLTMLDQPADKRPYAQYATVYIEVEVELSSILNKNRVKPLNKDSEKIAQNALTQWSKYKAKHRADNRISDIDIELNKLYMDEQMYRVRLGENSKAIGSSTN